MSYFISIVLDDGVLLASDKLAFKIESDGPKPENKNSKIFEINPSTAYLASGNMLFNQMVSAVIKYKYPENPIDLTEFREWGEKFFTPRAPALWKEIISHDIELFKKLNLPLESINVDFLVGGIDSLGYPFIVSSGNKYDFDLQIITEPFKYSILHTEDYILNGVKSRIEGFLSSWKKVEGKDDRWSLIKMEIPRIFNFVHYQNKYVGNSGDIFYLKKDGIDKFYF